jgi:actin-related protein
MFAGYTSRLLKEMKKIYKEKTLGNVENKTIKIDINIIDSPRRKYSVFVGATVLANTYNSTQGEQAGYWITKQDWDEVGEDIILKKCQNIIL